MNQSTEVEISLTRKFKKERLISLFIIGLLLFNYPLLSLFSRSLLIFGIPLLYLYLFSVWLIFIVLVAWVLESKTPQ